MAVVEVDVDRQFRPGLGGGLAGVEVDVLVLDRLPQPLHEHVVTPLALAVHADAHGVAVQGVGEGGGGELAALVGVHDLGRTSPTHALFRKDGLEGPDSRHTGDGSGVRC
jgi:hypothetical protein